MGNMDPRLATIYMGDCLRSLWLGRPSCLSFLVYVYLLLKTCFADKVGTKPYLSRDIHRGLPEVYLARTSFLSIVSIGPYLTLRTAGHLTLAVVLSHEWTTWGLPVIFFPLGVSLRLAPSCFLCCAQRPISP